MHHGIGLKFPEEVNKKFPQEYKFHHFSKQEKQIKEKKCNKNRVAEHLKNQFHKPCKDRNFLYYTKYD